MKILLIFIWIIVIVILWIVTVFLVVTKNSTDTEEIKKRNAKYLNYIKSISYIIAILFSLAIGYLLK
jgi:hypothetical protein